MLTQKRLKQLLNYDPQTGIFTWKVTKGSKAIAGSQAGCCDSKGYLLIGIDQVRYLSHRLAFLYMEGYLPENMVDHINRKRDDNRWENLRHASNSCNGLNSKIPSNNTSGYRGVFWCNTTRRWVSCIKLNRKRIHLGFYITKEAAAEARRKYEVDNKILCTVAYDTV